MTICFPVIQNNGLDSLTFEHFGSAPMFLLVDAITGKVKEQVNRDAGHAHGSCQPLKALAGQPVDAIVVGGIGRGALSGLNRAGLKVFKAPFGSSIADNLLQITAGELQELTLNDTCGTHSGTHGSGHGHRHGHGPNHDSGCGC